MGFLITLDWCYLSFFSLNDVLFHLQLVSYWHVFHSSFFFLVFFSLKGLWGL